MLIAINSFTKIMTSSGEKISSLCVYILVDIHQGFKLQHFLDFIGWVSPKESLNPLTLYDPGGGALKAPPPPSDFMLSRI